MRNYRRRRQERREQVAFVCSLLFVVVLGLLALTPAPVHSAEPNWDIKAEFSDYSVEAALTAMVPSAKTPDVQESATPEPTKGPEPIESPETEEAQTTEEPAYTSMIHSYDWDGEDNYMLAKIAMAEAEGESVEGKALVILVVLNRAWSEQFPDSIEEVIFQKNQFSPTAPGGRYWTTEPNDECYEAIELVMSGWDESQGALYFESTGRDGWHSRNLDFLFEYGGHKFYK